MLSRASSRAFGVISRTTSTCTLLPSSCSKSTLPARFTYPSISTFSHTHTRSASFQSAASSSSSHSHSNNTHSHAHSHPSPFPSRLVIAGISVISGTMIGYYLWNDQHVNTAAQDDSDHHSHAIMTKQWHYYSGPAAEQLKDLRLFAGNANLPLAQEIADFLGIKLSSATVDKFSDGEIKIQIHDNVRENHVFIVQPISHPTNDSLMELLLLISTMRRSSAKEITAVIPYYGYARQDRKMTSRVPISAADIAVMLEEMGVDRVISIDLHSGQIQGFFAPQIPVENLDGMPVGAQYFAEKPLVNPVIVAASAGGVLRAKRFREVLVDNGHQDTDLAMLIENREIDQGGRTTFKTDHLDLVGDVKGCDCIIIEDIVDTGFTMCRAADELKRQGALHVYAFASHGLFSSNAAQRIEASALDELVVTNTTPLNPAVDAVDKVKQLSLAPLIAETIKRVYLQRSLSSLFDDDQTHTTSVKKDPKASDLTTNMTLAAPKKKEITLPA